MCRLRLDEKSLWEAVGKFSTAQHLKDHPEVVFCTFTPAGTFPLRADCLSQIRSHHGLRGQHFPSPKPRLSWQRDGETVETLTDFILGGSKITADGDCSREIKKRFLLGRKVVTNLDSMLKSRDVTLPTKVRLVKAMVFPVVMYGCESWTVKKAECQRIDAFELWCWRRLLEVPWTAKGPTSPS